MLYSVIFFGQCVGPSYLNFKHAYLFLNIIHTGSETCWEFSHELKFLTKIYRNLRQILGLKHICSLLILCFLSTSKLSFLKRRIKSRYEFHKAFRFSTNFKNLIVIFSKKIWPPFMDRSQLSKGCRSTTRRHFIFHKKVMESSWYSFDWSQKIERLWTF